ncbi:MULTISPECIES: conjugal transfer protein TraF [Paraburkholderia]|uniref:Conjugal transfer protein TraF n=1 Tax=Paraburkholderia madseniana TaxID=2599607 RepID=A0AAP5BK66_9BURK|nr:MULTISPECIES: conjugal transfer protein TraF [Paraburkholderia]MCX4151029.1 conjugal transfer protein TraF [Paraburkholderia madseniana]MCX4176669.1 conjugal transfer protein TraF [Paraburkholderia madseniana]MDN7153961.1 conjugal transfer protein TraF [Paraburkholderia sp. WS6]MDQ6412843.1 conjugal transfer protein TraF [Paraburkholderia madseniana]MDQ6464660.1 conjugal transfer protein TraF [Paraburkholderia madseniana]
MTFLCLGVAASGIVSAQVTSRGDEYGDAFLHYEPYVTPGVRKDDTPKQSPRQDVTGAPAKPSSESSVNVAWLRQNYPMLEERAINDPTDDNVSAYMYTKRVILDKSQRFSEAVTRVLHEDPMLDENNRIPYASTGAQTVRNADYQAQEKAVQELAQIGGLLIFVDGNCRFCAMQLPVLDMLKHTDNLEYLVISIDGTRPKGYKGTVTADNGLYGKLGLKLTPSIVYVAKPRSYQDGRDPNRYLIVSQGFYAADELRKQIAYAGHQTELLSASTMRDLNVWDRGVASTTDLQHLQLDPNKPGTFRATLQPYLLKQY